MVRKPGGSQPATRRNETSCTHHAERKDRNRPVTTQNPGTLFTDGNGCVRRARRLSHAMGEELAEGRQVHLDGIGYFHPTLTCTEEIKEDTKRKNTKVRLKGIKFRADQELRSEIGNVKLKNIKHNGHSNKLSDEEIDSRLTIYFSQHHMMTRSDFQRVCGMMKSTAMGHIRRLRGEGKLKNIGLQNQPIYAPNVGYYGITEEVMM